MMDGMKIESQIRNIGQQPTSIFCLGISTCLDLMMSEIADFLIAFSPLPASPMAQESQFEESKRTADMHDQEESPSDVPITQQSKKRKLHQRDQIKPFRLFPILQGNNDYLHQYIDQCSDGKEYLLDNTLQYGIFGQETQIKDQRLQCLYLIIKECIRVRVVAETVHALPLLMCKASHHPEVPKGVPSHMDKVVSYPQQGTHRQSAENGQWI